MRATDVSPLTDPTTESDASRQRETILSRARAVLKAEALAVEASQACLGDAFVGAVCAILHSKGRICVTGVGKAGLIGNKIQATLASTGTLSYCLHPVEALHGDFGMVHPDDVLIALSKSGSSELVELLPRLKAIGCKVILLTARPDSPAAKHADFVLDIGQAPEACPLGLAPSSSTSAMLAVGDALALTVMELKSIQAEQYAGFHPGGALGRFLMKTRDVMRTGSDCPTVLVSATMASCHQAILGAPHRAGAACAVDEDHKLVGIITLGDFFRLFDSSHPISEMNVAEVMTRSPKCVGLFENVTSALKLMHEFAIDELPVVDDDGRVAGMIDIQDLVSRGFTVCDEP